MHLSGASSGEIDLTNWAISPHQRSKLVVRPERFKQASTIAANCALLIIAICFVVLLLQRRAAKTGQVPDEVGSRLEIGTKVSWSQDVASSRGTMLVAIRDGCHFCAEEMPFYKRLIDAAHLGNTHIVFLLPNDPLTEKAFIKRSGLTSVPVRQADFAALHISGTPTILLVDQSGKLRQYWIGKLPADQEAQVLRAAQKTL